MKLFTEFSSIHLSHEGYNRFAQEFAVIRYGIGRMSWAQFMARTAGFPPGFKLVTLRVMKADVAVKSNEALASMASAGYRSCNLPELMSLGVLGASDGFRDRGTVRALKSAVGLETCDLCLEMGNQGWSLVLSGHDPRAVWSAGTFFPTVRL